MMVKFNSREIPSYIAIGIFTGIGGYLVKRWLESHGGNNGFYP